MQAARTLMMSMKNDMNLGEMLAQRNSHTATTAIAATFLYLSAQCALDPSAIGIARAHPACDCLAKLTLIFLSLQDVTHEV